MSEDMGTPGSLDIKANRKAKNYGRLECAARLAWAIVGQGSFRYSPRIAWSWRRIILVLFGAKVGRDVRIHPTVRIEMPWNLMIGDEVAVGEGAILYALGIIELGSQTTVSQYSHICAGSHNYKKRTMDLIKASVKVGSGVWICADAFVGPGVKIGDFAVVGACAVVTRDVKAREIVAGNPAQRIGTRTFDE